MTDGSSYYMMVHDDFPAFVPVCSAMVQLSNLDPIDKSWYIFFKYEPRRSLFFSPSVVFFEGKGGRREEGRVGVRVCFFNGWLFGDASESSIPFTIYLFTQNKS